MNLMLTILFGVVGLVLSYGFFIPPELSMFRLIAAIGMMVGYRVGQLFGRLVRPSPKRFLILSVGAVLCFCFAFAYASMIQMGSANTSDIVNLGALLGLCFLSLGFLLPFTRVLVPNEIEILSSSSRQRGSGIVILSLMTRQAVPTKSSPDPFYQAFKSGVPNG
jgi:drug/metabolite transporter (DMT)-like permease